MMKHQTSRIRIFLFVAMTLFLLGGETHARRTNTRTTPANGTDVGDTPMAALPPSNIKPNVLFILDDSGSMIYPYMPDDASYFSWDLNVPKPRYGSASNQCNGLFYDPNVVYTPPPKADGTGNMPDSSFTAAPFDGYTATAQNVNLSDSFDSDAVVFTDISNVRKQPAFYFVYTGTATTQASKTYRANTTFYNECFSVEGSAPGSAVFTKKVVGANSGRGNSDERTNFANWYTFYRNRIMAMKTSAARAFLTVDGNKVRVGYFSILDEAFGGNRQFLKVADFSGTHRVNFFTKLYAALPTSATPLRAALSRAGRMYAGKVLTGADDPVQYSCQRNYTILSTDGYWNAANETGSYVPKKIDGSAIGNQDSLLARPMQDGTYVAAARSVITLSQTGSTSVTSITVNGVELMAGPTPAYDNAITLGPSVAALISLNGYKATYTGSNMVITAPTELGAITDTPVITKTGPITFTPAAFLMPAFTPGGASDTLADVAAYYYNTDLRDEANSNCTGALGTDVCTNNVPGSPTDNNPAQHMTTFTIGLGVSGTLTYDENYSTASSGDFYRIRQGTRNWPDPISFTFDERIDDLWHAAVNGHGKYFSAQNPESIIRGISQTLDTIGVGERLGASAAAATSNLEPVAGDNFVYLALYRSAKWDGDLQAKTIDPRTGALSPTNVWAAQPLLDAKVSATSDRRVIYTYDSTNASTKLKPFLWNDLTRNEQDNFQNLCENTPDLSQCTSLTSAQKTAMEGENLVNFLRGQYGFEDRNVNASPLFRAREHVLGDIIFSQPVYVKRPPFKYSDTNYSSFVTANQARAARVYVAANDGMLHAFNGDNGVEEWAYIPPIVLPNLYKLADKQYAENHRYFVDGTPTIGDICPKAPAATCADNEWKTILVGGLNNGGRGYYALDITNPASPKALWNFTNKDLGYTFGNPVITKRRDGTWIVAFASGYNNIVGEDEDANNETRGRGDGKGYLYVLNANTGASLEKIGTGVGSLTVPSGLAKINAWIDEVTDNTAKRFYGGDLLGNVWRFDIDDIVLPAGKEAFKLAELGDSATGGIGIQSITTRPELTEIRAGAQSYAVVNVATGRYLGESDLTTTTQQSIYAIKDSLTATSLGKVRDVSAALVRQTLIPTNGAAQRTTSTNAVDWTTKNGWYLDLNPDGTSPGERVSVDMQQQLGLLLVLSSVPERNSCTVGGYSWLYAFDFRTGQYVSTAPETSLSTVNAPNRRAGQRRSNMGAGAKIIKRSDGGITTLITNTQGTLDPVDTQPPDPPGSGARRISWREMTE